MPRTIYTNTSPRTVSELLAFELYINYCRANGTITAGAADINLEVGTPIAEVNGMPVPYNPEASDGSEIIAGLCLTSIEIPAGSSEDISYLTDGPAIVVENRIIWPVTATEAHITTAKAALRAKGIKFTVGQGTVN